MKNKSAKGGHWVPRSLSVTALSSCLAALFCGTAVAQTDQLVANSIWEVVGTPTPPSQTAINTEAQEMAEDALALSGTFTLVGGSVTTQLNTGGVGQPTHASALGFFSDGPSRGDELPTNQPQGGIQLTYTGDIGTRTVGLDELVFTTGICLSTGALSDDDPLEPDINPPAERGIGVEGPSNGVGYHPGEASFSFRTQTAPQLARMDEDFEEYAGVGELHQNSGDAAGLTFQVQVHERGLLEFTFVYGSDEYPGHVEQTFNDTFVLLVTDSAGNTSNLANFNINGSLQPFRLTNLVLCPDLIFRKNQIPPHDPQGVLATSDARIPDDAQGNPYEDYFDHEFQGFTAPLKREIPVEPGIYTIRIVIQDVTDTIVDSALFIPTNGIRLNTCTLQMGDFNGSGLVAQADLDLVLGNWGESYTSLPGTWIVHRPDEGIVDQEELDQVLGNWGNQQSNMNYKADFNRDGCVNLCDKAILDRALAQNIISCASIFEGDASGPAGAPDGAVDMYDLQVYAQETNGEACENCCGDGQEGTDNNAAGGEPDVWLWSFNYLLSLDAVAWTQVPLPQPGGGPFGPSPARGPSPAPEPAPVPPPNSPQPAPQPAPSNSPQPVQQPALEPIPEPQPSQPETQTQPQSQSAAEAPQESSGQMAQQPSLQERISRPNAAANGHERYGDIQEILTIAAQYCFNNRQDDARRIWVSVARVFGEDVLPDEIEIRW